MKTTEERLKSKGITPKSRYHNYEYLYKSIVEIMTEYEDELITINGINQVSDQKYIGSICAKCGKMSNHDEIDEDICIHCGEKSGKWKHIYEPPNEKYKSI